jgi:hypothetical protein
MHNTGILQNAARPLPDLRQIGARNRGNGQTGSAAPTGVRGSTSGRLAAQLAVRTLVRSIDGSGSPGGTDTNGFAAAGYRRRAGGGGGTVRPSGSSSP